MWDERSGKSWDFSKSKRMGTGLCADLRNKPKGTVWWLLQTAHLKPCWSQQGGKGIPGRTIVGGWVGSVGVFCTMLSLGEIFSCHFSIWYQTEALTCPWILLVLPPLFWGQLQSFTWHCISSIPTNSLEFCCYTSALLLVVFAEKSADLS